jgi:hypothetical protein
VCDGRPCLCQHYSCISRPIGVWIGKGIAGRLPGTCRCESCDRLERCEVCCNGFELATRNRHNPSLSLILTTHVPYLSLYAQIRALSRLSNFGRCCKVVVATRLASIIIIQHPEASRLPLLVISQPILNIPAKPSQAIILGSTPTSYSSQSPIRRDT